jgi:hypothetical protein
VRGELPSSSPFREHTLRSGADLSSLPHLGHDIPEVNRVREGVLGAGVRAEVQRIGHMLGSAATRAPGSRAGSEGACSLFVGLKDACDAAKLQGGERESGVPGCDNSPLQT